MKIIHELGTHMLNNATFTIIEIAHFFVLKTLGSFFIETRHMIATTKTVHTSEVPNLSSIHQNQTITKFGFCV